MDRPTRRLHEAWMPMASDRAPSPVSSRSLRPGQAWQLPLLLFSLALFGYAAYLFIDPKPGPTVEQRIESAREYLRQDRGEAAIEVLNKLLKNEKLEKPEQGEVRLLLARASRPGNARRGSTSPPTIEQIIKQTNFAVQLDQPLDADDFRRLGVAYERLKKPADALANYRKALPSTRRGNSPLHRKVIDLLVEQDQSKSAEDELDRYLAIDDITGAERAWGFGLKAQLLIDANKYTEARVLLDRAEKLAVDIEPTRQGELAYRLGYAASKGRRRRRSRAAVYDGPRPARRGQPARRGCCVRAGQDRHEPSRTRSGHRLSAVDHRLAPRSQARADGPHGARPGSRDCAATTTPPSKISARSSS